jgi:hypothetical protein
MLSIPASHFFTTLLNFAELGYAFAGCDVFTTDVDAVASFAFGDTDALVSARAAAVSIVDFSPVLDSVQSVIIYGKIETRCRQMGLDCTVELG